jgi:hypothetical protein
VNNRGHAVHCLAGVTPLRLYPRFPEQVEINRLKDQEGKGDIPNFTYDPTLTTRLANRPHTVPSTQIPITDGPNSWVVRAIATVP